MKRLVDHVLAAKQRDAEANMGKGIALMFREAFPANTAAYEAACKAGEARVGRMFVTENRALSGPRWIIDFPTKKHWRHPSKLKWVQDDLEDLKRVMAAKLIKSIALPPLGCGDGCTLSGIKSDRRLRRHCRRCWLTHSQRLPSS